MKEQKKKTLKQIFFALICILLGIGLISGSYMSGLLEMSDLIYATFHIVCIESCIVIAFVTNVLDVEKENKSILYQKALTRKSVWLKSEIAWLVVYYWLIGSSLLATIIVIYIGIDTMEQRRIVLYSIFSLFFCCAGYVVNAMTASRGYRKAYCLIDAAILKYEQDGNNEKILGDAMIEGEKFITEYTFKKR